MRTCMVHKNRIPPPEAFGILIFRTTGVFRSVALASLEYWSAVYLTTYLRFRDLRIVVVECLHVNQGAYLSGK